ncbi:hypothetical protein MIMGU_mgv1a025116mg [Erythranthe guttata]|uniref:MATH domain-containing protein n=1 Tax=Erythranthe guttata TaxID=4155 RepID=A0A022QD79_ERYGU|nr:hypothetical protein MIMGU_mgv1a025116mg [Erythranthe guttata]
MRNCLCVKPATKDEVTTLNTREAPPAHFMINIESFSVLEKYGIKKYETKEFFVGDYKCNGGCLNLYRRLIFKFNGKDSDYISVNLAMADTTSLPTNWEVNALFSVFLFNQISGNYLSSTFFVVKREAVIERVLLTNVNTYYNHALEILSFSQSPQRWVSEEFDAGGQKWKILLYPKGNAEGTGSHFLASSSSWGRPVYIDLATINDPNKGFIVKDCCLLNIEINVKAVARVS